eukprot:GAHX01002336.1.p1 GENE.GAHX01002336.1~~GAHX01002336.1.p1  ORF type:complete len:312 (-),score=29.65 GAHX01002336.1:93-1028(-)
MFRTKYIILFLFLINPTSADYFNYCIQFYRMNTSYCPTAEQSTVICKSKKLPISATTSTSSDYDSAALVILPGQKIRCVIYCRNSQGGNVISSECKANYFSFTANLQGKITNKKVGTKPSTVEFYYEAPQFDNENVKGGKEVFDVLYNTKKVSKKPIEVKMPPLVSQKSTMTCSMQYILQDSYVKCKILPRDKDRRNIVGTPFEFKIELGQGYNTEYGNFGTNGYLAATSIESQSLEFQYKSGSRRGCNTIKVTISDLLPADTARGQDIAGSGLEICTVLKVKTFFRTMTWPAVVLTVVAGLHSFLTCLKH